MENCCEGFVKSIERIFPYLFSTYGFKQVFCDQKQGGERCVVVFESSQCRCRLRFYLDRGIPEYSFGVSSAPFGWETKADGVGGWYSGDRIAAFLGQQRPQLLVAWPTVKKEWNTEDILSMFSRRLSPFVDETLAAFSSNLNVEWWSSYRKEVDEAVRKIKDQLQRGERVTLRKS